MSHQQQFWRLMCVFALANSIDIPIVAAEQVIIGAQSGLAVSRWDGITQYTLVLAAFSARKDALDYQRRITRHISAPVYIRFSSQSAQYLVATGPLNSLQALHRVSRESILNSPAVAKQAMPTQRPSFFTLLAPSPHKPVAVSVTKRTANVSRPVIQQHRASARFQFPVMGIAPVSRTATQTRPARLGAKAQLITRSSKISRAGKPVYHAKNSGVVAQSQRVWWLPEHFVAPKKPVRRLTYTKKHTKPLGHRYIYIPPFIRHPSFKPIQSGLYAGMSTGVVLNTSATPSTYAGWQGTAFGGVGGYIAPRFYLGAEVYGANNAKIRLASVSGYTRAASGWSYGADIMPGVLLNDYNLFYLRLGGQSTTFYPGHSANYSRDTPPDGYLPSYSNCGWQLGLGEQSKIAKHLELRLEGTFTDYNKHRLSTKMYSSQVNLGLVYKPE